MPDDISVFGAFDAPRRGPCNPTPPAPVISRTDELEAVFGKPVPHTDWREVKPPQWLVEGFLQRGSVTMLSGKGGLAKSLLTQDLFIRLASGENYPDLAWLGGFRIKTPAARVVVIEKENGANRFHRRCHELVLGGAFSDEVVDEAFSRLTLFSADGITKPEVVIDALHPLCDEHTPDLIVLDPLRSFLPTSVDNENDNVSIGRVVDKLVQVAKSRNIAILVVDHDSKAGGYLRGASAKADAGEFIAHLTAPEEDDLDLLKLEMKKQRDPGGQHETFFRRSRCAPPMDMPGFFPIAFVPETRPQDGGLTDRERAVLQVIEETTTVHTLSELKNEMQKSRNFSPATTSRAISVLVRSGLITKSPIPGKNSYYIQLRGDS